MSSETFRDSTPASRSGRASSSSRCPLVESATSSIPGVAFASAAMATTSLRRVGSPPVMRMRRIPSRPTRVMTRASSARLSRFSAASGLTADEQ